MIISFLIMLISNSMNPLIFIITCIVILIIIFIAYHQNTSKQPIYNKHHMRKYDRVRCPPKQIDKEEEVIHIPNKGYVDDTIFKPKTDYSELKFENTLIKNTMPLNDNSCILSTPLPIANINVYYLLNNESVIL